MAMVYRRLGSSGLKVSALSFGSWVTFGQQVTEETAYRCMVAAREAGVNFFDNAEAYAGGESERVMGRILKRTGWKRSDLVLSTKIFWGGKGPNDRGLSRKHLLSAIDASLKRLGTDYVDLYQIHRLDEETPMEEALETLHGIVRSGKARYIGASSMYGWQFAKLLYLADQHGWTRFVSMQNHYNLAYREEEREMMPLCVEEGIGVIPWSPLARGLLTGSRTRGDQRITVRAQNDAYGHELYVSDADYDVADRVEQIAREKGVSRAQVALAWLLSRPAVTAPIIGATKLQHLDDAVAALEVGLTEDEQRRLEEPYVPHAVAGII